MVHTPVYSCKVRLTFCSYSGLMKDHGQQARASENFARPVDFETPRSDLFVHF